MLRRTSLVLLIVIFVLAAAATAQMTGKKRGMIFDDATNGPVPEVTITITDPEAPSYRQVFTSDKRGRYRIILPTKATVPLTMLFEKEGYQAFSMPSVRFSFQETRENFHMTKLTVPGQAPVTPTQAQDEEELEAKGGYVKVYNTGVGALERGDIAGAERMFTNVLETKEDYGPAFGGMARVYWKQEKWSEALEYGLKSAELNPDDTEINQVLYAAYVGLGRKKEAAKILTTMTAADPEKAGKNLFNQAADLYNQGDTAGAKPILQQVVAADPANGKAYYMLGLCYISEGANDEAKAALNKFLEIAPNDPDIATAKEMISYLE